MCVCGAGNRRLHVPCCSTVLPPSLYAFGLNGGRRGGCGASTPSESNVLLGHRCQLGTQGWLWPTRQNSGLGACETSRSNSQKRPPIDSQFPHTMNHGSLRQHVQNTPGCAVVLRPFQGRDSTRHIALEPSPNEPVDASDCQEMRCVLYAHATVLSDLPRQTLASCASVHSAYLDNASGHDKAQYKLKDQCRRR